MIQVICFFALLQLSVLGDTPTPVDYCDTMGTTTSGTSLVFGSGSAYVEYAVGNALPSTATNFKLFITANCAVAYHFYIYDDDSAHSVGTCSTTTTGSSHTFSCDLTQTYMRGAEYVWLYAYNSGGSCTISELYLSFDDGTESYSETHGASDYYYQQNTEAATISGYGTLNRKFKEDLVANTKYYLDQTVPTTATNPQITITSQCGSTWVVWCVYVESPAQVTDLCECDQGGSMHDTTCSLDSKILGENIIFLQTLDYNYDNYLHDFTLSYTQPKNYERLLGLEDYCP